MSENFGNAVKPLTVKCLSIGSPSKTEHYLCIVTPDNRQFYFDLTHGLMGLLSAQSVACINAWPEA